MSPRRDYKNIHGRRERRKTRLRARIRGTASRARLSVFRSGKHIYAQLIDDGARSTFLGLSDKVLDSKKKMTKTEKAGELGRHLAERALKSGIKKIVFDRSRFAYHGRIKALAEGARRAGLEF